jgi:hypothetical protein
LQTTRPDPLLYEAAADPFVAALVNLLLPGRNRLLERVDRPAARDPCAVRLRVVLNVGEQIPDVRVWIGPREPVSLRELVAERPALFLFYLFDWSST